MFERLFKKTVQRPGEAIIVPMQGNAQAVAWHKQLVKGQWREFNAFLHAQQDPEWRDFYLSMLSGELQGWPKWIDQWVEESPGDPAAHLFRGWRYKDYAWEVRGSGFANNVDRNAWGLFFSRLEAADAALNAAAELAPDDAGPWVPMVTTAYGRQLGIAELRRRFAEVERRRPLHTLAARMALQGVAAKWTGSHEMMFEFARAMSSRASAGSTMHVLIAEAHLEFWMQEQNNGYWKSPFVRDEIVEAGRRALAQPIDAPYLLYTRNAFALCYWLLNEPVLLAEQVQVIGGRVTRMPWAYLGQPLQRYAQAQARAAA